MSSNSSTMNSAMLQQMKTALKQKEYIIYKKTKQINRMKKKMKKTSKEKDDANKEVSKNAQTILNLEEVKGMNDKLKLVKK